MAFQWRVGERPPLIEEHSMAKLTVLRDYLHGYHDTVLGFGRRDEYKLDLVDGFAGGGIYLDNNRRRISGSPLVMLEESAAAETRMSATRKKSMRFDVKHHFVEANSDHAKHLRKVLDDRGYPKHDPRVALYGGQKFVDVLDRIVADIARHHPRSGRSIFLLDQCGYTDVPFNMIRRLRERLPKAEVIMTIAIDALLNFATRKNIRSRLESVELSDPQTISLMQNAPEDHLKAMVQRTLPKLILRKTGFRWFTPFYIRPSGSRRELWFVHLSRHLKAQDVMLGCHWNNHNSFMHYGDSFGPDMLGRDALERTQMPLLTFDEANRKDMKSSIREDVVHHLHDLPTDQPQPYVNILDYYGNKTAATHSDMNDILIESVRRGDIEVRTSDGKRRDRTRLRHIKADDVLARPRQLSLLMPPARKIVS